MKHVIACLVVIAVGLLILFDRGSERESSKIERAASPRPSESGDPAQALADLDVATAPGRAAVTKGDDADREFPWTLDPLPGTVTLRVLMEGIPAAYDFQYLHPEAAVGNTPALHCLFVDADGVARGDAAVERRRDQRPGAGDSVALRSRDVAPGRHRVVGRIHGHAGSADVEIDVIVADESDTETKTLRPFDRADRMRLRVRRWDGAQPEEVRIGVARGRSGRDHLCPELPMADGRDGAGPFEIVVPRGEAATLFVRAEGTGEIILPFATGDHEVILPKRPSPLIRWTRDDDVPDGVDLVFERDLPEGTWAPPMDLALDLDVAISITERPGYFVPLPFPGPGRYRVREERNALESFVVEIPTGRAELDVHVRVD